MESSETVHQEIGEENNLNEPSSMSGMEFYMDESTYLLGLQKRPNDVQQCYHLAGLGTSQWN